LRVKPIRVARRLVRSAPLVALALTAAGCRIEVVEDREANLQQYAERMLASSAAAWNRGDLDAFLGDYAAAPTTSFVGSSGLVTGIDSIRALYAPRFAPGARRDSLRYEKIRAREFPSLTGIVTGRWILHRNGRVMASGPFTLVMRRGTGGWKIVHDHSSTDFRAPAPDSGPAPAGAGAATEEGGEDS
jgi:ketosteroid isomerase-like protein